VERAHRGVHRGVDLSIGHDRRLLEIADVGVLVVLAFAVGIVERDGSIVPTGSSRPEQVKAAGSDPCATSGEIKADAGARRSPPCPTS